VSAAPRVAPHIRVRQKGAAAPGCDQRLVIASCHQQRCQEWCRSHDLLEIIQQQKHLLAGEMLLQVLSQWLAVAFLYIQRLCDGRGDQPRVANWRQEGGTTDIYKISVVAQ
jgi:hypothetical protein